MNWMPIIVTEMASFLSKTRKWKSPGSDKIPNHRLKTLPATNIYTKPSTN